MHRIDLLKGQGIPAKTTFAGMVIIAVTVIVPIIVGAAMIDRYVQNWLDIDFMSRDITKYKGQMNVSEPQVELYNSSLSKRAVLASQLSEVSRCVNTFVQWSPIIVTVARDIPAQMIINGFSTQYKAARPAASQENGENQNKEKPVEIPIPERSIMLDTQGRGEGNYDTIARNYLDSLKASEAIKARLNSFDFIREAGRTGEAKSVSYKLNFIFKTGTN
jgi:hypothetical protein